MNIDNFLSDITKYQPIIKMSSFKDGHVVTELTKDRFYKTSIYLKDSKPVSNLPDTVFSASVTDAQFQHEELVRRYVA